MNATICSRCSGFISGKPRGSYLDDCVCPHPLPKDVLLAWPAVAPQSVSFPVVSIPMGQIIEGPDGRKYLLRGSVEAVCLADLEAEAAAVRARL